MIIERIAIAIISGALALGQAAEAQPAGESWITPSKTGEGLYDIDWPGGTLEQYARQADAAMEEVEIGRAHV